MARFQFSDRSIELDFCGKLTKRLEVNSELMKNIQRASDFLMEKDAEVKNSTNADTIDLVTDYVMDAIDMILGDGEADKIMAMKPGYSAPDVIEVYQYIFSEINAYPIPSYTEPQTMNRAQRRAARRLTGAHAGHEHYELLTGNNQ